MAGAREFQAASYMLTQLLAVTLHAPSLISLTKEFQPDETIRDSFLSVFGKNVNLLGPAFIRS
jgi:hypothetical protein